MRTVVLTVLSFAVLSLLGAAGFIYSGLFNVAATDPHSAPVYWVLDTARVRSIKAHASEIAAPADWNEEARVVTATAHFSAHCAICHGAPGVKRGDLAAGMYPLPPDLSEVSTRYTPEQLFWILKNGIKMSGMPSMADDGDDMLWSTVAFLERLPGMSADDYNDLWMTSQAQGGMDHMMNMGGMTMPGMTMAPADGSQPSPATERASMPEPKPGNHP